MKYTESLPKPLFFQWLLFQTIENHWKNNVFGRELYKTIDFQMFFMRPQRFGESSQAIHIIPKPHAVIHGKSCGSDERKPGSKGRWPQNIRKPCKS